MDRNNIQKVLIGLFIAAFIFVGFRISNITGLNFQQQKKLNKAVKNARILGMYPFTVPLI